MTPSITLLSITILKLTFTNSFSIQNDNTILNLIQSAKHDATTLSPNILDYTIQSNKIINSEITISNDFDQYTISIEEYKTHTSYCHTECMNLFDDYKTNVVRCERIPSPSQEYNIRWSVSWIGAGSLWLYTLSNFLGWKIQQKVPDYTIVSAFSWKSVFQLFSTAFQTGGITLPYYSFEGNTNLKINYDSIMVKESIDLVKEADLKRIQNRKVAQEFASWLDVRRPYGRNEEDWAGVVRERILTFVPNAGVLDIDPMEDDDDFAGIGFGIFSIVVFLFLYSFLVEVVIGGVDGSQLSLI